MKLSEEVVLKEDLRRAMRSFHRLIQLKEMKSPDVLIETELKILHQHFAELSAIDLKTIMYAFSAYHQNELVEDECECEQDIRLSKEYFKNLS